MGRIGRGERTGVVVELVVAGGIVGTTGCRSGSMRGSIQCHSGYVDSENTVSLRLLHTLSTCLRTTALDSTHRMAQKGVPPNQEYGHIKGFSLEKLDSGDIIFIPKGVSLSPFPSHAESPPPLVTPHRPIREL